MECSDSAASLSSSGSCRSRSSFYGNRGIPAGTGALDVSSDGTSPISAVTASAVATTSPTNPNGGTGTARGTGASSDEPPAKKARGLPPMLVNAKLKDVDLEPVLLEDGSPKMDSNKLPVKKAKSVAGISFNPNISVDMIRALCVQWGITRYAKKKKEDMLELIAQKKELGDKHEFILAKQK